MATPSGASAFKQGDFNLSERESAYASARGGRRFAITHQTPGTVITGQTSFVATTPTFILYQAAGARRVVLSSITLSQDGTVAGAKINVCVALDRTNRFSAGGTAIVPQNYFADPDNATHLYTPGFTFKYNATASAAGASLDIPRYVGTWSRPQVVGDSFSIDFKDSLYIGKTGSILIYTWAATTGPSWSISMDAIEED